MKPSIEAAGYETDQISAPKWSDLISRGRLARGLDTSLDIRCLVYTDQGFNATTLVRCTAWAIDSSISLAQQRAQIISVYRLIMQAYDPSWTITIPEVPVLAVRLRELLDTRSAFVDQLGSFVAGSARTYTAQVAALKVALG